MSETGRQPGGFDVQEIPIDVRGPQLGVGQKREWLIIKSHVRGYLLNRMREYDPLDGKRTTHVVADGRIPSGSVSVGMVVYHQLDTLVKKILDCMLTMNISLCQREGPFRIDGLGSIRMQLEEFLSSSYAAGIMEQLDQVDQREQVEEKVEEKVEGKGGDSDGDG